MPAHVHGDETVFFCEIIRDIFPIGGVLNQAVYGDNRLAATVV
jgi:hypothetical protein